MIQLFSGCLDTPVQGKRICSFHQINSCQYVDDSADMDEKSTQKKKDSEENILTVMKILDSRETRSNKFYKVIIIFLHVFCYQIC